MKKQKDTADVDEAIIFLRWGKQNLLQHVYSIYTYKQISFVTGKSITYCRRKASSYLK